LAATPVRADRLVLASDGVKYSRVTVDKDADRDYELPQEPHG